MYARLSTTNIQESNKERMSQILEYLQNRIHDCNGKFYFGGPNFARYHNNHKFENLSRKGNQLYRAGKWLKALFQK
jgi:hypothetical protein